MRNNGSLLSVTRIAVAANMLLFFVVSAQPAIAQSFSVLHTFGGQNQSDGASPYAGLTADSAGNLYGTTYDGGIFDFGTVFELPVSGGEKILHNFTEGPMENFRMETYSCGRAISTGPRLMEAPTPAIAITMEWRFSFCRNYSANL